MKKVLYLLVLFLISCSTQPQVTVTSEVTVTLPPMPTQTPEPTTTPEPALPAEVQEKFGKAGIDVKNMSNAKFDQSGLHITIEGQKTIDISTAELEKFVYFENGTTKEILTFLPVRNTETKQTSLYAFDITTKIWSLSEVLEPLNISTDESSPSSCIFKDVISGHLTETLHEQKISFPEDAKNYGWGKSKDGSSGGLYVKPGSIDAVEVASICRIKGDFLGTENEYDIVSVKVLNVDGSTGFLNLLTQNNSEYKWSAKHIINEVKKGDFGFRKDITEGEKIRYQDDPTWGPITDLYDAQGGNKKIRELITEMLLNDAIPAEMEKVIFIYSDFDQLN